MSESRDSCDQRAASKLCGVHNKFTLLNVNSNQSQFKYEFLNFHIMSCFLKYKRCLNDLTRTDLLGV